MELKIIERNGWEKVARFDKAVVRIGSAPSNDISLISAGIAPIHLQVIRNLENPGNCKILNFGSVLSVLSEGKESTLETGSQADLRDCDEILLGEYRLIFHLPLAPQVVQSSRQIAATLFIPDAILHVGFPTTAFLKLQNLGAQPNCQFQVTINGLQESCYHIDPLPILYPGASEDVRIQFFHRNITPPAGNLEISISITAPSSYPGEEVVIRQELFITPVLNPSITIIDDMSQSEQADVPPLPAADGYSMTDNIPSTTKLGQVIPSGEAEMLSINSVVQKDNPPPKVVRNPSEAYWDENS